MNLLESTEKVILDCQQPNGAIVAAPSNKDYYPKDAKDYFFVWPRDGALACMAATIIGIPIHERFFDWCQGVDKWKKWGLFHKKYNIDGSRARKRWQPDQAGNLLMALHDHYKEKPIRHKELLTKTADALCRKWNKTHFSKINQEVWEQRNVFPDLKQNFTYTLAACSKGLRCANEMIPTKKWKQTADEMKAAIIDNNPDYFKRSFGIIDDDRIDASMLGLVWPYEIVPPDDPVMKKTIKRIEQRLVIDSCVHRFEHDEYDGWMCKKVQRKQGAGYWPLLNFWMSIYYSKSGSKKKALQFYNKVLDDVNEFIPEQIFDNDIQVSVSPLLWSHAMWVFAAKELNLLNP